MADTKVSALPAAGSALDTQEYPVNEAGTSKKVTGSQLRSALGTWTNVSTSAQTPAAATRTYLVGSAIIVPPSKLKIGTIFQWQFDMTKTAAGSATSTFDVAIGTAGTTADTARLSFTKNAGTAAVDVGFVTVTAVCRGPLSAAGVFSGAFQMTHAITGGGHSTTVSVNGVAVSAAFDVTTAGLIVGLCITTGAADAITIQQVLGQAFNL